MEDRAAVDFVRPPPAGCPGPNRPRPEGPKLLAEPLCHSSRWVAVLLGFPALALVAEGLAFLATAHAPDFSNGYIRSVFPQFTRTLSPWLLVPPFLLFSMVTSRPACPLWPGFHGRPRRVVSTRSKTSSGPTGSNFARSASKAASSMEKLRSGSAFRLRQRAFATSSVQTTA